MLNINHKATEVVPQNGNATSRGMDSVNPAKTTAFPSAGEGSHGSGQGSLSSPKGAAPPITREIRRASVMLPPQLSLQLQPLQGRIGGGEGENTLNLEESDDDVGYDENAAWQEAMDASYDNIRKVGVVEVGHTGESPEFTMSAERRRDLRKKDTLRPFHSSRIGRGSQILTNGAQRPDVLKKKRTLGGGSKGAVNDSNKLNPFRQRLAICASWMDTQLMIYPSSRLQFLRTVLTIIFVLWTTAMLPIELAFYKLSKLPAWWTVVNVLSDIFFLTDVVLSFNTCFVDIWGALVTNRKEIANEYVFGGQYGSGIGWFWVDLTVAIPWDAFNAGVDLRWAGTPKLFRIIHLYQLMSHWKEANIWRIARLFLFFMIVAHVIGCAWFSIGFSSMEACTEKTLFCSWLASNDLSPRHENTLHLYVKSLYWAITTMTSVGYGDITPITTEETIFAIFIMLIGSALYATIFSNMASYIQSIDSSHEQFRQKVADVKLQMRYLRLPKNVKGKVESYYEYMWRCHKGLALHRKYFYEDLPPALHLEIANFLFEEKIQSVALFSGCTLAFFRDVQLQLKPQVCIPSEYIVNKDDVAHAMYFIMRGTVEVLTGFEGNRLTTLTAPQYFGETAILESRRRTASIRALTFTDMYYLLAVDMRRLLLDFREDEITIYKNALKILDHVGKGATKIKRHRSTYTFMKNSLLERRKIMYRQKIQAIQQGMVTSGNGGSR